MKLILASSSQYRHDLLKKINANVECIAPNIDETALDREFAGPLALRLSRMKALSVAESMQEQNTIVIGSDQVACYKNQLLGKPHTKENAVKQLTLMSGQQADFFTGLFMLNTKTKETFQHIDRTRVFFRDLNLTEIERYIEMDCPLDCSGSFKSEGLGLTLFENIETEDPSALIGLPLIAVNRGLIKLGFNLLLQ